MNPSLDRLTRQLEELPTVRASEGFTAEVLKRLDEQTAHGFGPLSRRLVWGAVVAGIAGLGLMTLNAGRNGPSAGLTAEVTEIRREHELLRQELNRLRTRTESTAPFFYLGGIDDVDYVLDLSPYLQHQAGRVLPASNIENTTF